MRPIRPLALAALSLWSTCLWPSAASAVTFLGFDEATPLHARRRQVELQGAFGDEVTTLGFTGRFGLYGPIDFTGRIGLTEISDRVGFEVEAMPRLQVLTLDQTANIVDVSIMAGASLLRTGEVLALGLDGGAIASRRFRIAPQQSLFVAATLGVATTYTDVTQGQDTTDYAVGLLGAATVGVDVYRGLTVILEGRVRDEFERLGLGVRYLF